MEKEKLKKKLAKFAGFYQAEEPDYQWGGKKLLWHYPGGDIVDGFLPDFPESLDALKDWIVPKLKCVTLEIDCRTKHEPHTFATVWSRKTSAYYKEWAETPALAFSLAVEKLVDKEVKDDNNNRKLD